jgi:hypothetical protein
VDGALDSHRDRGEDLRVLFERRIQVKPPHATPALALAAAAALAVALNVPAAAQTMPAPAQAATQPAQAAPAPSPAVPAAAPADVASIDAILAALYDVISGPAGAPRNWDRFRSLFAPGARLVPLVSTEGKPAEARVLSPDGYIERSSKAFAQAGFYEKEAAKRVESFGALTHVWSTYEARRSSTDPEPFLRGINSIQLINDGSRWWIVTVAWQAERPDLPLPDKYRR